VCNCEDFTITQRPEGKPPFFTIDDTIRHTKGERILKDFFGQLKAHSVLGSIELRLPEIPSS